MTTAYFKLKMYLCRTTLVVYKTKMYQCIVTNYNKRKETAYCFYNISGEQRLL